jgi:hypothetical protein
MLPIETVVPIGWVDRLRMVPQSGNVVGRTDCN